MPPPKNPPKNFLEILKKVWWPLDRALDEASLRAAARLYVGEALLLGTTTLIDHHESAGFIEGSLEVLADTCQELGARALLCYGATERNGGREEARRGLLECRRFIRANTRPLVQGAIGLHAPFTVSDETLQEAGELCRATGRVLHLHVAEDTLEVAQARKRGYEGVLQRLVANEVLVPGSILAHGVHLQREEVEEAARLGCWFVQNPRSNKNNHVGYPEALKHTRRVALGTDGFPSDMRQERQALLKSGLAHGEGRPLLEERARAGRLLAREVLGLAPEERAFEELPGDRVVTDPDTGQVREVLVAGRKVVEDGSLISADMQEIRATARVQARRLWQRLEENP